MRLQLSVVDEIIAVADRVFLVNSLAGSRFIPTHESPKTITFQFRLLVRDTIILFHLTTSKKKDFNSIQLETHNHLPPYDIKNGDKNFHIYIIPQQGGKCKRQIVFFSFFSVDAVSKSTEHH